MKIIDRLTPRKKFHSLNPVRAKKLERIPSSQLFRFLLPPYKGDSSSINMELYAIFFYADVNSGG